MVSLTQPVPWLGVPNVWGLAGGWLGQLGRSPHTVGWGLSLNSMWWFTPQQDGLHLFPWQLILL